ncbi:hypothetical protein [Streptomyces sp. MN13]
MNADEFNARYPVGTPVLAYPSVRPEHPVAVAFQKRVSEGRTFGTTDPCKRLVTRTRTPAWTLGHGEPVVSVDGYAGGIVLEHVDVISEEQFEKPRAEETAAAVAALGALPMPVGDQPQPLTDARLAEITARVEAATPGPWRTDGWEIYQGGEGEAPDLMKWIGETCRVDDYDGSRNDADFIAHAREDVPALLAEVQRLKAELAGARERALHEAADWFDRAADAEPDEGYRARVMRGAANDIRRLVAAPNKAAAS